jgi:hypothetical protein
LTDLTRWTWIAVGILVTVPPVVFVLFLRDASRVFRELQFGRESEAADRAGKKEAA